MKKLLLPLLLAVAALGVRAQENDGLVYPNTFYASFNVGAFSYAHSAQSAFGAPAANITGGVWVSEPLAFQLSADAALGTSAAGYNALFFMAAAEFKWDANATFFHLYNKNFLSPIPFYPILSLGIVKSIPMAADGEAEVDNALHAALGLQAPLRIASHTDAILQYKCIFFPQGFDGSLGDNYMHTFGLGLLLRQSTDPYHRRIERYTRGLGEDWFFGLGLGPNYSGFDLFSNPYSGGLKMVGVAPEIMMGRNFSNYWSVRFVLNGLTAHEPYDTVRQEPSASYRYSSLHTDLMLNLSSLVMRGRGVSFNALAYLGSGPIWRYDKPQFHLAADFGVMMRYYLDRHSDLYLDCRYVVIPPSIGGGHGPSGDYYGVSLPSITLGYIYNFGHNSTRYRMPLDKCTDRM